MRQEKKRYHVARKNKADVLVLLRGAVCAYLLYLGWQLIKSGGSAPSFPPFVAWLLGGVFFLAAAAFARYAWGEYKQALKEAELTPEEEAALRRETEE